MKRRHLLAILGISVTAGCMERLSADSETGIRLGSIRIANTTDETHNVDLLIERNNEFVYHDGSEINADNEVWIEPTWSSEPAEYDLYYVISGIDELQVANLTELHEEDTEGDCLFADIWIVEGGEDSIVTAKDVKEQQEATCNF
ncbi:hypothetical protein ACLI4Y_17560 [Natrialbaceae archaeon A-CW3]